MDKWTFRLLWLLVFSIPIENMIVLPGVGTISRSIGMVAAAAAFLSVCLKQEIRKPGPVQWLFVAFLLWILASFYWSIDLQKSLDAIKVYAKQGIFIWLIWEFAQTEERQVSLMKAYVLGAFIAIASILNAFLQGQQSSYFRYSAQGFDPNDIGLTIAIGVPIAWYIGSFLKDKIVSWAFCLYVPLAFIAIILTASRSAFICLMVSSIFVILSFRRLSIVNKFAVLILVTISGFLIFKYVPSYSWARIMTIGSQISAGDLGSRFNIWRGGLEAFSNDPLFGSGIGTFSIGVEKFIGVAISPHNLFLSIMVDLGIVGLFIFLAIVLSALVGIIEMDSLKRRMWIFVFATWLIGVMTLSWAHRKPTWFLISLVAVQGATYLKQPEKVHTDISPAKI